ncbi:zinc finger protein 521-like [Condylostylus longicornis]|uniref:zinc finger protein 521-like n=1 Tax=Condylostylus longicornis TaxID=2530218 RepID=UPI00244E5532|nr:zinc finger protein 521-like [Condylostylus longicornis]
MSLAKLNLENVVFQIVGKTLKIIDNPIQSPPTSNSTNIKKNKTINENDKKFGEIYLAQDGRFYYNCEFCNNNYFCIKYFTKHLIEEHKTLYTQNASIQIVEEIKIEDDHLYATQNELNQSQVLLGDQDMQMETVIYEEDSDNQNYIEQIHRQQQQDQENIINENENVINNNNTATNTTTTTYTFKDDNVRIVNDPSGNTYRIETVETVNNHQETEEQLRKNAGSVLVALETELLQEEYNNETQTIYANDFVEETEQQVCSQGIRSVENDPLNLNDSGKRTFFDDLYDSFEYKKCKLCNVKTGQMLTHLKYKHPNAIKCNISDCNMPFDSEEEYNAHKAELHINPNFPFQCKSCSYKCKYRSGILNHYNRIHLQKPKFQCNLCDKSFYAYHVRKRHIKECHNNGKLVTVVKEIRNDSF